MYNLWALTNGQTHTYARLQACTCWPLLVLLGWPLRDGLPARPLVSTFAPLPFASALDWLVSKLEDLEPSELSALADWSPAGRGARTLERARTCMCVCM